MNRGELYRVRRPGRGDPKPFRTYVIVSRPGLITANFPSLVCAPVYSEGQGLSTQVAVGVQEGLKHESWIACDALVSLDKSLLTYYVGSLSPEKVQELNQALKSALALAGEDFLIQ